MSRGSRSPSAGNDACEEDSECDPHVSPLQGARLTGAETKRSPGERRGPLGRARQRTRAPIAGSIFPVDRLPFPPLVSATMKTALILVGRRVGKAV